MSRRCHSKRTLANAQRRVARARFFESLTPAELNLMARRLATAKDIRKARANATAIAELEREAAA